MIVIFCVVVLVLAICALFDEFRNGSILDARDDLGEPGELFEFPVPPGWTPLDVLTTYAEIESL